MRVETRDEAWSCGCETEHRPTIGRAWCFACSEWCYPSSLCVRGEVEVFREFITMVALGDWVEGDPLKVRDKAREVMG
jgi:hypothetical protein